MKFGRLDIYIKKLIVFAALILFVSSFLLYISVINGFKNYRFELKPIVGYIPFLKTEDKNIKAFSGEEEFKEYIQNNKGLAYSYGIGGGMATNGITAMRKESAAPAPMATPSPAPGWNVSIDAADGSIPGRISQTNVQTAGIDEPDILKTDGKEIYFSPENQWVKPVPVSMMKQKGITWEEQKRISPEIMPPYYPTYTEETKLIKAFPPADLALDGKIDKKGDLLLNKNILMIFSGQEINAYDVSDPKSSRKKWNVKLEDNNYLIASRLYKDKVYLVTRNMINESRPCPIALLKVDGAAVNIKCQEIYHPVQPVTVDSTFIAMVLDPNTGKIEKTVSFAGSAGTSTVYMSENSIYITYVYNESTIKFFFGFLKENNKMFPSWLTGKITKLEGYDISENAKLTEFLQIMEKYQNSLSSDDRLKAENEMQNKMSDYYEKHRRELEKTGIVKADINEFKIASNGVVPGHLLNNFSLDEYKGSLRVAITLGQQWGIFGGMGRGGSTNDIYVLDSNMNIQGSIKDFGQTEQIYSVRFVGDTGFVVTFRQTDPFFVMDLADPKNPELKGELKIPGYSSYLHPLDKTHILGVGMESGKVKISLFDVSDKTNPVELDKYLLDEYWTDVSNNYHAFLLDDKHNVFFLPGGKGGYVFSYSFQMSNDCTRDMPEKNKENCYSTKFKLTLQKAISQVSARRAIYLNDYMYIVGDKEITVLNEKDWEKVNEFEFNK